MSEVACTQTESDAALNHILAHWHRWQRSSDRGVRGFNSRATVVGDCRPWHLQYEGQLDQLDADMDNAMCRQVDHEVREMGEPHRSAIYCDARNLCTGLAVWSNPRLPVDPREREIVVRFARVALIRRLISAGVM